MHSTSKSLVLATIAVVGMASVATATKYILTAQTNSQGELIIDNGQQGYWRMGHWQTYKLRGYDGDTDLVTTNQAGNMATWTFNNLAPGEEYEIWATWEPFPSLSTSVAFTVNGKQFQLNQRERPSGETVNGSVFQKMGEVSLSQTQKTILVSLKSGVGQRVEADAIRVKKLPRCGDSIVTEFEECDDGNSVNGDGCSAGSCLIEVKAICGDGYVVAPEECDDRNTKNGDGCSSVCKKEVAVALCGNGRTEAGEQCDDGNTSNTDGCSQSCLNARCGDGFLFAGVEQCDDGNTTNGDTCNSLCKNEVVAQCNDGIDNDGDGSMDTFGIAQTVDLGSMIPGAILYDSQRGLAYVGTYNKPAKVLMVDENLKVLKALDLPVDFIVSGTMDEAGDFAYFTTYPQKNISSHVAQIVKIKLSDFSYAGILDLPGSILQLSPLSIPGEDLYVTAHEHFLNGGDSIAIVGKDLRWKKSLPGGGAIVGTVDDYAYRLRQIPGTANGYSRISKIRLSDLEEVLSIDLPSGPATTWAVDEQNGLLYVAHAESLTKLLIIRLSDLSILNTMAIASVDTTMKTAIFDDASLYLTTYSPSFASTILFKVNTPRNPPALPVRHP